MTKLQKLITIKYFLAFFKRSIYFGGKNANPKISGPKMTAVGGRKKITTSPSFTFLVRVVSSSGTWTATALEK